MARKYKRDGRGRFAGGAGGSGGSSGGSKGSKGRSGASSSRREIPKNGSKGLSRSKPKVTTGAKFRKGAQAAAGFAKKNPHLVLGAAYAAASISDSRRRSKTAKLGAANYKRKTDFISDKRGMDMGVAGLKAAKRTIRGAYKISSR